MADSPNGTDRGNGAAEGDAIPLLADSQFYRVLASSHRRYLLYFLLTETEGTVEELTTALGGWDATSTGMMHTPADRSKLSVDLVHLHLPLLQDAGLVEYDPESGSVRLESLHPRVTDIIRKSVEADERGESERCSTR